MSIKRNQHGRSGSAKYLQIWNWLQRLRNGIPWRFWWRICRSPPKMRSISAEDGRRYRDQQVSLATYNREEVLHEEDMLWSHSHIHLYAYQIGCDDFDGLPRYRDAVCSGHSVENGKASRREGDNHETLGDQLIGCRIGFDCEKKRILFSGDGESKTLFFKAVGQGGSPLRFPIRLISIHGSHMPIPALAWAMQK